MMTLPFRFFDCDNHYYEATDAFTRHLERGWAKRTMHWAQIEGRTRLLVGGKVNRFIPNPTFDPVAKPGAQALREDVPALRHAFRAFNRWLNEDWGFAYAGRIAGGRSPADPAFDPFWARANEAGITVLYHGGESHYTRYLADWGESGSTEAFRATAFRGLVSANPTQDTIASMLAHHLFQRFPRLRVASIRSARTGCPTCSTSSRSPTGRRRPCTRRTRGRRSGGTSGSRRSTTTSWARSRT
ncbi:MAG: amidohydrolase family protein [Streptosporangiaceae bacterium]